MGKEQRAEKLHSQQQAGGPKRLRERKPDLVPSLQLTAAGEQGEEHSPATALLKTRGRTVWVPTALTGGQQGRDVATKRFSALGKKGGLLGATVASRQSGLSHSCARGPFPSAPPGT